MTEKETLEKRLSDLRTLKYLKRHDVNIRKVYSDINCDKLINDVYHRMDELEQQPFRRMTDEEYLLARKVFA